MNTQKLREYIESPEKFRAELLVDANGTPTPFGAIMEPFQARDFAAMDDAWLTAMGHRSECTVNRSWTERPRGHSKTSDLAVSCAYALAFPARPLIGAAFAADRDQSKLLRNAINRLIGMNPLLAHILRVDNYRVVNVADGHPAKGSELNIESRDAPTAMGRIDDFVICDEISNWSSEALWESVFSTSAKKPRCLLSVITNAGFTESWQFKVREAIRNDPRWHFSRLEKPEASWIDEATLAEQRRLLPAPAFDRLWRNAWCSGASDALTHDDIESSINDDLKQLSERQPGWSYAVGLDLGIKRDASAICVVGVHRGGSELAGYVNDDYGNPKPKFRKTFGTGRTRLAYTKTWTPRTGRKVNLEWVEKTLLSINAKFRPSVIRFDPWQAEYLAQRLTGRVRMTETPFQASNLQAMASAVLEAFNGQSIELYRDERLISDLKKLRVVEKNYGFRLESPRDSTGHGDLATAFQLAMLGASEIGDKPRVDLDYWIERM